MSDENRIRVVLGCPTQSSRAYRSLYVHQGNDQEALEISFWRTIRVPEDGETYDLPLGIERFSLYNISDFAGTLPESMTLKCGCFIPVRDGEPLWIKFKSTRPFAIKILLGGINAISGEPIVENFGTQLRHARLLTEKKHIQDYIVVDTLSGGGQLWLNGIARVNGKVMQFISVKSGSEYSIESQITGQDAVGGIQIIVTPIKRTSESTIHIQPVKRKRVTHKIDLNSTVYSLMKLHSEKLDIPISQFTLLYNGTTLSKKNLLSSYSIQQDDVIQIVLKLKGGGLIQSHDPDEGEMGIGAGGFIKQSILTDPHASDVWDRDNTGCFNVQLLNATLFQQVVRGKPPASIPTASAYADAKLPFFSLPEEENSGIEGQFEDLLSIGQIDHRKEKGVSSALKKKLKFRAVRLNEDGSLPAFKSVADMKDELRGLGLLDGK